MRLTEKNEFGYILHIKSVDNSLGNEIAVVGKTADKLGQLEDIEDELGIDLLTLFKVWNAVLQKEYLWTKYNDQVDATDDVEIGDEVNGLKYIYFYWPNGKHLALYLEDYGKTWSLTKEELEHEQRIKSII